MIRKINTLIRYRLISRAEAPVAEPPQQVTPQQPATPPAGEQAVFTKTQFQSELNRINAEERRKAGEQNKELVRQLEQLRETATLTEQQKTDLEKNIEDLKNSYQTDTQIKEQQIGKLQEKYDKDTKSLTVDRDAWRGRFENTVKSVELLKAANQFKAFNPQQIAAILDPVTRVVEAKDSEGKPSGDFNAEVDFTGIDKKTGNPVKLKLSVSDAVKMMTEMPEQYGNLFRTDATSGLNMNPQQGGSSQVRNLDTMSASDYQANRKQIREELAKEK